MSWRKVLEEEREGERTDAELNRDLWRKKDGCFCQQRSCESRASVLPGGWALASFGLAETKEFIAAGVKPSVVFHDILTRVSTLSNCCLIFFL